MMDINTSPPQCPNTISVRRNPPRKARPTPNAKPETAPRCFNSSISELCEIPPFPNEEIFSPEIPQSEPSSSTSQNIRVYLRIRPLLPSKGSVNTGTLAHQNPKSKAKYVWPQNPSKNNILAKKKSSGVCIVVADPQSVTLLPPPELQESKRIKSETYGGFTQVFPSDTSQIQVYETMVKPILQDFLMGKSGMLAAMGPSGSGKTHTVFGCPREPGMVTLALRHIFKETEQSGSQRSRSFYISMFEIYSERGKVEKLFNLLADGGELSMLQSTVKGLQEVLISNAEVAESLIAQALLKRATAMTNTNSQSSRSQCIINIRDASQMCEEVVNAQPAVLTIIDLAGAEREKKTGNQPKSLMKHTACYPSYTNKYHFEDVLRFAFDVVTDPLQPKWSRGQILAHPNVKNILGTRLLESNFINNTLMVFSLCLRSLLQHQKNPKKPLQKHFQNSMLTRYLRDYLEGKKRMTLILTTKSGEEDYLDTSLLLRQASPYMKIKYNEVETSNMVPNKRQYQTLSTMEHGKLASKSKHAKRMRLASSQDINEETAVDKWQISKKGCNFNANSCVPLKPKQNSQAGSERKPKQNSQAGSERNYVIMQNFAKAIWNVLKQHNAKLKVAEVELCCLKESLGYEKKKNLDLERELNDLKACCTCCKGRKVKIDLESKLELDAHESTNIEAKVKDGTVDPDPNKINCIEKRLKYETIMGGGDYDMNKASGLCCVNSILRTSESLLASEHAENKIKSKYDETNYSNTDLIFSPSQSCSIMRDDCSLVENQPHSLEQKKSFHAKTSREEDVSVVQSYSSCDLPEEPKAGTSCEQVDAEKSDREVRASSLKPGKLDALDIKLENTMPTESLVSTTLPKNENDSSPEDVSSTKACETIVNNSCNREKPRRRLMPSSSILLKDMSSLDLAEGTEKPKGNRGIRKSTADDLNRTNGSILLLRLLKSNLPH